MERLRPNLLAASDGTNRGKAFTARRFAEQLQLLYRHLRDHDMEIDLLRAQHPDTKIFTGFPDNGPVTAATLLGGMGEDRSRYPSAGALLAEKGPAPVTRASGRIRIERG